jgi:hypothetical protein
MVYLPATCHRVTSLQPAYLHLPLQLPAHSYLPQQCPFFVHQHSSFTKVQKLMLDFSPCEIPQLTKLHNVKPNPVIYPNIHSKKLVGVFHVKLHNVKPNPVIYPNIYSKKLVGVFQMQY